MQTIRSEQVAPRFLTVDADGVQMPIPLQEDQPSVKDAVS